jgi:hypothetical protein
MLGAGIPQPMDQIPEGSLRLTAPSLLVLCIPYSISYSVHTVRQEESVQMEKMNKIIGGDWSGTF